jgi:hypothetical protein
VHVSELDVTRVENPEALFQVRRQPAPARLSPCSWPRAARVQARPRVWPAGAALTAGPCCKDSARPWPAAVPQVRFGSHVATLDSDSER